MADILVSHTRADQQIVRRIVALLEAQGWSVRDNRRQLILRGKALEDEIDAVHCVVVVWTPRSINRRWMHRVAQRGSERGILVSVLIGVGEPPAGFREPHHNL